MKILEEKLRASLFHFAGVEIKKNRKNVEKKKYGSMSCFFLSHLGIRLLALVIICKTYSGLSVTSGMAAELSLEAGKTMWFSQDSNYDML